MERLAHVPALPCRNSHRCSGECASGRGRQVRLIYRYPKRMKAVHESLVPDISTVPNIGTSISSYAQHCTQQTRYCRTQLARESCLDRLSAALVVEVKLLLA